MGQGCYPARGRGARPDPTPVAGSPPQHRTVSGRGKGVTLSVVAARGRTRLPVAGSPPQHSMVSGWGKGATLPRVAAQGRTLLPTALQGVPPLHHMVSGWGKGATLPRRRAGPDSRIAGSPPQHPMVSGSVGEGCYPSSVALSCRAASLAEGYGATPCSSTNCRRCRVAIARDEHVTCSPCSAVAHFSRAAALAKGAASGAARLPPLPHCDRARRARHVPSAFCSRPH